MGYTIKAVVKNDSPLLVDAPFEKFKNNGNVIAENAFEKEFFGNDQEYPGFQLTIMRRLAFLTYTKGEIDYESFTYYNPEEVKQFYEDLKKVQFNNEIFSDPRFPDKYHDESQNKKDFESFVDFFKICADEGFGVAIV